MHGWPFPNNLAVHPSALALAAPPVPRMGLGAGMCWSALDRYFAGVTIPRELTAPRDGDPLHAELVRRQAAAVAGLWPQVREWQALSERAVTARTRTAWLAIRSSLDAGEPVLLGILPSSDGYTRGHSAWHVLATGWSAQERRITLSIYDPGRPGDNDACLGFSLGGALDARLTGGQKVRAFFALPYDRSRPRPERVQSFADRSVLGLNRKVEGALAAVAARAGIDLVARGTEGALLHFRRRRAKHWEGSNVTEREGLGRYELHGDPAAIRTPGTLHVFGRGELGDLLHFRLRRRWSAANRTEQKHAGPEFRITGAPLPVRRTGGRLSVFAADGDGGVIHYSAAPLRPWSAEALPGQPIIGDPLPVVTGKTLHVLGVTRAGGLLHRVRKGHGWESRELTAGDRFTAPIAGRLAHIVRGTTLHLWARDTDHGLVHFWRSSTGEWHTARRPAAVAGDPTVVAGPGGIHVFAPAVEGLIHCWGEKEWFEEDILATRASLDLAGTLESAIASWGDSSELRVFGRWGGELRMLGWRRDSDWSAIRLRDRSGVQSHHQPADHPLVMTDGKGRPHLFATDGAGTVLHVEETRWTVPVVSQGVSQGMSQAASQAASQPLGRSIPATPGPAASSPIAATAPARATTPESTGRGPTAAPEPADEPVLDRLDFETEPPPAPATPPSAVDPTPQQDAGLMDLALLDTWPPPPAALRRPKPQRERSAGNRAEGS